MSNRTAMWLVAGPLIALKAWATALLFLYEPTRHQLAPVLATTWPWVVLLLVLVAAPGLAWYRLVRVRARRKRLLESEWMVPRLPIPSVFETVDIRAAEGERGRH